MRPTASATTSVEAEPASASCCQVAAARVSSCAMSSSGAPEIQAEYARLGRCPKTDLDDGDGPDACREQRLTGASG
jgi:hypothetical protein